MSVLRVETGTASAVPVSLSKNLDWLTSNGVANTGGASGGGDANPNDGGASRGDPDANHSDACANPSGGRGASRGDARARDPSALVRA